METFGVCVLTLLAASNAFAAGIVPAELEWTCVSRDELPKNMIPALLHEDASSPFDVVHCSDPQQEEEIIAAGTGTCDGTS
ncbi:MAG: hypothetical protein GY822_27090 [Deltaproteobacteria bacterium]|nr:hypothetical protein [Deltaproteobacteria bacterium]